MRDLNTLNDAALLRRHSRLVAADLAERAKPPVPPKVRQPVHAMCLAMSEVYQLAPAEKPQAIADGITDDTAAVQAGAPLRAGARLADIISDCTPVAAAPDVWHKTARAGMRVTVAKKDRHGFPFMPSMKDLEGSSGTVEEIDNADGTAFVQMDGRERYWFDMHSLLPVAEADAPPISDWRPGDQVPEGERKQGLWHYRCPKHGGKAGRARSGDYFIWSDELGQFRPAAPGVREGEAYDESKYGVAG